MNEASLFALKALHSSSLPMFSFPNLKRQREFFKTVSNVTVASLVVAGLDVMHTKVSAMTVNIRDAITVIPGVRTETSLV